MGRLPQRYKVGTEHWENAFHLTVVETRNAYNLQNGFIGFKGGAYKGFSI